MKQLSEENGDSMEIIEKIKNAGVVGAGGAGFPTHVKLNAKAEYLLINAVECEPLIETDKYLCRTYARRIIETVVRMAEPLEAVHVIIAVKKKYVREQQALQDAIDVLQAPVKLFLADAYYPAGDEQMLVQEVTGRCVPERGLPLSAGCVVENVGTVLSIADALEDKPVTDKFLSVTGAVRRPAMFRVPLGTPIKEVLCKADITSEDYRVILGGPMMGRVLADSSSIDHTYVTKTLGNLLVLPKDHHLIRRSRLSVERMAHQAAAGCIQCRMCTDLCPRYLLGHEVLPNLVMRNLFRERTLTDEEAYQNAFGSAVNCCGCGACEMFSCPMGLSPRKINNYIKAQLNKRGIKIPVNQIPQSRTGIGYHKIPAERLTARLDLTRYQSGSLQELKEITPKSCWIPLSQHIGVPAEPVVQPGCRVEKGDLIAAVSGGISANIHAGISGMVTEVSKDGISISGEEG